MVQNTREQTDEDEVHTKKFNLKISEIATVLSKPDKEIVVSLLS